MAVSLVQTNSDAFLRSNGALGANWSNLLGVAPTIVGNAVQLPGGAGVQCLTLFNGQDWPNDQFAQMKLVARNNNSCLLGPAVRCAPNTKGYFGAVWTAGFYAIVKLSSFPAAFTVLVASTQAPVVNDVFSISAQTLPTGGVLLTLIVNGISILTFTDTTNPLYTGFPGFIMQTDGTQANTSFTNWTGGAVVSPPTIVNAGGDGIVKGGLERGNFNVLGTLTAAGQCVQFSINPKSEEFLGRLQMVVTPKGPAPASFPVGAYFVLLASQDGGASWWLVPAATVPNMAPGLLQSPAVYTPWYDVSGLGSGAIFQFGFALYGQVLQIPSPLQVEAMVG